MIDKYNREINYARISLTSLCNLRCAYCGQDDGKSQKISVEFYETLIEALDKLGIRKIRFTGGEPLLYENIIKLVKYTNSFENIKDIAITTNGVLLDRQLDELVESGLTRINFSLDSIDRKTYASLTGSDKLDGVLENINKAKEYGLKVKVNAVLLKSVTLENLEEFLDFGYKNNVPIRFIELMPFGDNMDYYRDNYLSSEVLINMLNCKKVPNENNEVATYYRYDDKYDFGIITPISDHFCERCNRIRITSRGNLRLCLHSDNEIDLLQYKGDAKAMYNAIALNIISKPEKHLINEDEFVKTSMVSIGG